LNGSCLVPRATKGYGRRVAGPFTFCNDNDGETDPCGSLAKSLIPSCFPFGEPGASSRSSDGLGIGSARVYEFCLPFFPPLFFFARSSMSHPPRLSTFPSYIRRLAFFFPFFHFIFCRSLARSRPRSRPTEPFSLVFLLVTTSPGLPLQLYDTCLSNRNRSRPHIVFCLLLLLRQHHPFACHPLLLVLFSFHSSTSVCVSCVRNPNVLAIHNAQMVYELTK